MIPTVPADRQDDVHSPTALQAGSSMTIVTDAGLFNESSEATVRRRKVTQGRRARGFVAVGLLAITAAGCVSDRGAAPDSLSAPEFSAPTPTAQNPVEVKYYPSDEPLKLGAGRRSEAPPNAPASAPASWRAAVAVTDRGQYRRPRPHRQVELAYLIRSRPELPNPSSTECPSGRDGDLGVATAGTLSQGGAWVTGHCEAMN
jgi:hypothetical protein